MTIDKIKEKYLSLLLAFGVIILNILTSFSSYLDMSNFMDKTITFSSISFGFLITVLSLLIQTNTPALTRIKESGKFTDLINFNKKAVVASAILVVCALIYLAFKLNLRECLFLGSKTWSIRILADTIALAIFVFQAVEVYLFLDLFYFIIKQKD